MLNLNLQFFAHKKGMGSTKNGRDSNAKRLGAKKADGQFVKAGNILYRQRGTSIHPGLNVGIGGDDTLYALTDGILRFERVGKDKKRASVHPVEAQQQFLQGIPMIVRTSGRRYALSEVFCAYCGMRETRGESDFVHR